MRERRRGSEEEEGVLLGFLKRREVWEVRIRAIVLAGRRESSPCVCFLVGFRFVGLEVGDGGGVVLSLHVLYIYGDVFCNLLLCFT